MTRSITGIGIHSGLVLALGLAAGYPVHAQVAGGAMDKGMMMQGPMMSHQGSMGNHWKTMIDEMKAQDASLAELVDQMNSAKNDAKTDLIAAVVTRLVEQRRGMTLRMERMHQDMMQNGKMGKGAMPHHPKMQNMGKKPEAAPDSK